MGSLVQDASPFLFPCTIEYSLICAAILYVMWKNISRPIEPTMVIQEGPPSCKRYNIKDIPFEVHINTSDLMQVAPSLFCGLCSCP